MSAVKIATLDRLIAGDRHDPILIVGKAIGLEWATVRALILLRLGPSRVPSPADIETARREFRAADALDRRAGRQFLANPSAAVTNSWLSFRVRCCSTHRPGMTARDVASWPRIRCAASGLL